MELFFTTSQTADQLKVSAQTVRNLYASGQLKAERTVGGHLRVAPSELERLKALESLPTARAATSGSGSASRQIKPNPHQLLAAPSPEVVESAEEAYITDRELVVDANKLQQMKIRKEAVELQDFFDSREQVELEAQFEEDQRRREQLERQAQERRAELAAEERQRFMSHWIAHALTHKPADSPSDYALLIQDDLLATLNSLEPDTSEFIVENFVHASIIRALRPSRAAEERLEAQRTAGARALSKLPVYMQWNEDWLAKARKIVSDALEATRENASERDMTVVCALALHPLIREYERQEKIQDAVKSVSLPNGNYQEKEGAQKAIRTALSALPLDAGDQQIEEAKSNALAPIAARIQHRRDEADRQAILARDEANWQAMLDRLKSWLPWSMSGQDKAAAMTEATKAMNGLSVELREKAGQEVIDRYVAKHRLIETGLSEVYSYAQRMLQEFDYEGEAAWQIEHRVKAKVEETLRKELRGTEELTDVVRRVHTVMKKLERCR